MKGRDSNKSGESFRQRTNNCFVVSESRSCTRDVDVDIATNSNVSDGSDDDD